MKTLVQKRLFNTIVVLVLILSVMSIVGNIIVGYPLTMNIKWIILLVIGSFYLWFARASRYSEGSMIGFFIFLILFFFPFGYIESGGAATHSTGYVFLTLISVTYLFRGWRRIGLVVLLISMFIGLQLFEYFYPEFFPIFSETSQFIDRLIQVPLILFCSFIIIWQFSKDYERVNEELYRQSNFDELTGLYNRRKFNTHLDELVKPKKSQYENHYIALVDLDNFKLINDNHGHNVGDKVLQFFAKELKEAFPEKKHVLSRWGGDEFAIVFNGSEEDLTERLEKVRHRFENETARYDSNVSFSVGMMSTDQKQDISQILIETDMLLYKNKHNA